MNKFKKLLRREMDVEFFSTMHAMCNVIVLGFFLWLNGFDSVQYAFIFESFIMSYIIAWLQKGLFFKEKIYSEQEYNLRAFIWNAGAIVINIITAQIFGWFENLPLWMEIMFICTMLFYYILLWFFIQIFYKDETKKLNDMLSEFKASKKEIE